MNCLPSLLNIYTNYLAGEVLSAKLLIFSSDCKLDKDSIKQTFRSKIFENDKNVLAKKVILFSACTLPREVLSQITFDLELVNFHMHLNNLLQWRPFSELMLIKEMEAKHSNEKNEDEKSLLEEQIQQKKDEFEYDCATDTSKAICDLASAHIQNQPMNFSDFNVINDGNLDENKLFNLIRIALKNKEIQIFKGIRLLSTCNFLPKELIQRIACKIKEIIFFQTKEGLLNFEVTIVDESSHTITFKPFSDLLDLLKIRKQMSIETSESEKVNLSLQLRAPSKRITKLYLQHYLQHLDPSAEPL